MTNNVEYKEIMAFHPGYYIQETIEELKKNLQLDLELPQRPLVN